MQMWKEVDLQEAIAHLEKCHAARSAGFLEERKALRKMGAYVHPNCPLLRDPRYR